MGIMVTPCESRDSELMSVVAVWCCHSQCPVQFCVQMTYADRHRLMCVRALACQKGEVS